MGKYNTKIIIKSQREVDEHEVASSLESLHSMYVVQQWGRVVDEAEGTSTCKVVAYTNAFGKTLRLYASEPALITVMHGAYEAACNCGEPGCTAGCPVP